MQHRAVMQRYHQFLSDGIVAPRHYDREFISADTIHRTVPENIADHFRGIAYIFISGLVPQSIIDLLQTVHVTDCDRKSFSDAIFDLHIVVFFAYQEGMLALDSCHRINIGQLFTFFCPPVHEGVIAQHYEQREKEQSDRDD